MKIRVNNLSGEFRKYRYVIFRVVNGENWYWGVADSVFRASEIVAELGKSARIIESCDIVS